MKQRLFKVKPHMLDAWQAWAQELQAQRDEVIETLREENAIRELASLFYIDEKPYVYMAIEFSGEQKPTNLERELNTKHRSKLIECLEPVSNGELLYKFDVLNT